VNSARNLHNRITRLEQTLGALRATAETAPTSHGPDTNPTATAQAAAASG